MLAARPRRAHEQEIERRQQPGAGGPTRGDEERRQLRIGGRADRQPRHRQRHREDDDAEQAEGQTQGLAAAVGGGEGGHGGRFSASVGATIDTPPVHFRRWFAPLYCPTHRHAAPRRSSRRPPAEPSATLSRRADTTLAEQLTGRYAERIRQRLLAPGARLPSVRECARRHAVSPATVVSAYDQLLARGLVEARPHRGFFVRAGPRRSGAPAGRSRPAAKAPPRQQVPNSATALIRGMFQPPGRQAHAGPRHPARRMARSADARRGAAQGHLGPAGRPAALQYGDPAGEARLREALAIKLADHGIAAHPGRSSPRSAPPMRSTSSPAPCCAPATACWSTSPAGRSSTRAWPRSACACCRCRAAATARTWRRCGA